MDKTAPDPAVSWRMRTGRRRTNRAGPWIGSAVGHVLLLGLVLALGVNLAREHRPGTTPVITAELGVEAAPPLLELAVEPEVESARPIELPPLRTLPPRDRGRDRLGSSLPGEPGPTLAIGLPGGTGGTLGSVEFAGLRGGDARRIAFVVDASGSMIGILPTVVRELDRSIANLSQRQSFAVVFFQGDRAVAVPPGDRLVSATTEHRERTMQWIEEVIIPAGRSSPLEALEHAVGLGAEVVYLLSGSVSGSGSYEVDVDSLLQRLDAINPVVPGLGRRSTRIKCIQFMDPDPVEALRRIAEVHSGEDASSLEGYRLVGRSELGLDP